MSGESTGLVKRDRRLDPFFSNLENWVSSSVRLARLHAAPEPTFGPVYGAVNCARIVDRITVITGVPASLVHAFVAHGEPSRGQFGR